MKRRDSLLAVSKYAVGIHTKSVWTAGDSEVVQLDVDKLSLACSGKGELV